MKITEVRLGMISVPLRVPFKTALRSVNSVEDVVVEIHTDTGAVGYGEAPPTGVITGDTTGAIIGAMKDHIIKTLVGRDVDDFESVTKALNGCIVHNTSARAAADMALWDLYGQLHNIPVYKLLGGGRSSIVTDITISVNKPEEMQRDAINAVERGYDCLKVKVGSDPSLDVARLSAIREVVPKDICIRIDANQGWTPKQAVRILNNMQDRIKTLSDQIYEDIQSLRESGNYDVEKRLGVEIMALNALCNATKTSTIHSTRTSGSESRSWYGDEWK